MTRSERAKALFLEGYNCSQSVVLAFSDVLKERLGLDREAAAKLVSAFGGGLGRMRGTCGCVNGMAVVAGAVSGYSDPEDQEGKAALYGLIQELAAEFAAANGSLSCRELLMKADMEPDSSPQPSARTAGYYRSRPCPDLAASAAGILERRLLNEHEA